MAFNLEDYEQVKDRLPLFFELHKEARVTTEPVWIADDGSSVITLTKIYRNLDEQIAGCPFVTGLAREESGGMISAFVENAETSSIGRALANRNIYGAKGRKTGNRPSREEMESVQAKQSLSDVARTEENLKEVEPEDYSEFEEVIAPPEKRKAPAPKAQEPTRGDQNSYPPQSTIRENDGLQAFDIPETFSCVWGGYCNDITFLKQEIAKRGPHKGDAIVACRIGGNKHGKAISEMRGDGKEWCNYEEGRAEFQAKAAREETNWRNGSEAY